jgi:hypothetical protein
MGSDLFFLKRDCIFIITFSSKKNSKEIFMTDSERDPAVSGFLDLLEGSLHKSTSLSVNMMDVIEKLVSGVEVDLDAPLEGDVDI